MIPTNQRTVAHLVVLFKWAEITQEDSFGAQVKSTSTSLRAEKRECDLEGTAVSGGTSSMLRWESLPVTMQAVLTPAVKQVTEQNIEGAPNPGCSLLDIGSSRKQQMDKWPEDDVTRQYFSLGSMSREISTRKNARRKSGES